MIYSQLFDRAQAQLPVRAGIIGTGQYATAIVTQSVRTGRMDVVAVADSDPEAARRAFSLAGLTDDDMELCLSTTQATGALERGKRVILEDALLLAALPLDVIVESTGIPEAGARHAQEAIRQGKHVVMVNKEADCVVGPVLKHLADGAGVVYTAADGDQPSLLLGLIGWAEELGLEILCAGKAGPYDLVLEPQSNRATCGDQAFSLRETELDALQSVTPGQIREAVSARQSALGVLSLNPGFLAEMAIVANAASLAPDVETLHGPIARISEIPEIFCPESQGGILEKPGIVDGITCLREAHEAGLAGGIFVVVDCKNEYELQMLSSKGHITNSQGTAMLIDRPYHLLGVETVTSILCAQLLGLPTGAQDLLPRYDVVARTTRAMRAGEIVSKETEGSFQALMRPARPVSAGAPLPYYMIEGNALTTDLPPETLVTAGMVHQPTDSALWSLRAKQDQQFLGK